MPACYGEVDARADHLGHRLLHARRHRQLISPDPSSGYVDRTARRFGTFSVWRLAWVAHQVLADPRHLFDGNIFHPNRDTLAYSDAMLLPAIVLAPFNWMGISPLVVYNLTLFAAFVASAVAAFLLVRELTASTPAALVGGLIFAFSAHRLDHFDHLELQFAFWIPLAVLYWHRAVARDRGYLIVGLLAAGQILSSIYHGIFFAAWLAVATVLWFVRTPLRALRAVVLILWLPLVTLAVYSLPYMKSRAEVGDRPMSDVVGYSAHPMDFLSAPANNVLYGWTDELATNERHLFPGIVATLLLVVGLWPPLDRTRAVHAAALAFALLLTLGVNGPIYKLLYDWVLPFRGLRVPARADILVLLGTSVLAGFGLTRLMSAMTSRRMAAMAAAASITLASVECLARPTLIPANPNASVVVRVAADRTRRGGVRVARDGAVASLRHEGRQVHVPLDAALAPDAQRLQRSLSRIVRQAALHDAGLSLHSGTRGSAAPRRHRADPPRRRGLAPFIRSGSRATRARPEHPGHCGGHGCGAARNLLPPPSGGGQFSVFLDRATASATMTTPQASSAATCGHSTCQPTPFRKIPRTMMMK